MTSGKDKTKIDVGTPARGPAVDARPGSSQGKRAEPDRPPAPARATSDADVADFVRRMKELGPRIGTGNGRLLFAMDATMSRQPTWDMALALQADMFHAVKADRRPRRAARVFPRRRRMPGLQVGVRPRCAGRPDDARHLRRRLHADRQGAEPRAQGGRRQARQCAGLRRRLHGGGRRRPVRACRRAGAAGRAGVPVPGRLGRARRARLPRDRPPHARRLLRLRCRLGRSSCATCSPPSPSTPPAAARRWRR